LFACAVKKDTAAELAKKREQERQRQEKLAETSRLSRYRRHSRSRSRSFSRSPPRYFKLTWHMLDAFVPLMDSQDKKKLNI